MFASVAAIGQPPNRQRRRCVNEADESKKYFAEKESEYDRDDAVNNYNG